MATSSGGGYGTYSPAAIDPFPIESVLAKIVGDNNPGNAANLLGQYQVERQTSQGNYDYAMNQQHQFARESLAQQMANEHVKNLLDANKTPGGLPLLQQSGNAYDIDPALITRLDQNQRDMQRAEQAQKGAAAAYSLAEAGAPANSAQLAQLTSGLAGPQGTPLSTTNAQIAANARLAAARIRGSSTPGPSMSVKGTSPWGEVTYNFPGKMTQEQVSTKMDELGAPRINTGAGPAPLPPEARAPAQPGTSGAGSPNTSAPPAAKNMTPRPNNAEAGKKDYQTLVASNIETYKQHPGYADIKEGMQKNGGNALVVPDGKGGWRPQGASGKVY